MPLFEFTLKFSLPNSQIDPNAYIEKLYENSCDDALIGIGTKGYIALDFIREASSAYEAIYSAITDVKAVIPKSRLIEATTDCVSLTETVKSLDVLGKI
ncbi:MAG: DNA-binding protein [Pseudanabaena sp.]|jgi:hypothetical protein